MTKANNDLDHEFLPCNCTSVLHLLRQGYWLVCVTLSMEVSKVSRRIIKEITR